MLPLMYLWVMATARLVCHRQAMASALALAVVAGSRYSELATARWAVVMGQYSDCCVLSQRGICSVQIYVQYTIAIRGV